MKVLFTSLFTVFMLGAKAQLLSWSPEEFPGDASSITITLDANYGNGALKNYSNVNDVYVHTGVITNLSATPSAWKYVKFNQNFNTANPDLKATSSGTNQWTFTINNIRNYYGVPGGETVLRIAILFRNGAGTTVQRNADGSDMYIPIYAAGLRTRITNPFKQPTYDPRPENILKNVGDALPITAKSSTASNMRITFNGVQVASQNGVTTINGNTSIAAAGSQRIIAEAEVGGTTVRDTADFFVASTTQQEALPAGVATDGVTYHNGGTAATLVFYAPNKSNVVVIGDFNDWTPQLAYQMKRTPDNLRYWIRLEGLTPGTEYAYQYQIDGSLRVADYNTEKVLDPWNDPYINEKTLTYPNLKPYPTGKATDIVSVLEPGKAAYNWSSASLNFQRPDKRNLIVYELLVRDFSTKQNFQTVIDSINYLSNLGVNCIHLMPVNEFEGNNSWGYNPSFMFAVDKYYGPENKLRELIDICHQRGIAVVLDMVLNHQFGQSPLARMYWDAANNRPASNSPWLNPVAKHGFNVGYDMNHEAQATQDFVYRVMQHWLVKYKVDGFRWDLSKGFTQTQTCDNNGGNCNTGSWSNYDQSRVNIWNRIYDQSQAISPNTYMILEHLGADNEEATLAKKGMLLWGKMTDQFKQAAMGYSSSSDFGRAYHTTRWSNDGGNDVPLLMAYGESHDEERINFNTVRYGNSGTTSLSSRSRRMQATAAFLFTIPGPKLMWQFGELAYDSSINMCENLTLGDCRTAPKPSGFAMPNPTLSPTQNYFDNSFRRALYNAYSRLIRFRTTLPNGYLPTFSSNIVDFSLGGDFKWQRIQSKLNDNSEFDLDIVVVGNFGVSTISSGVTMPAGGTWHLIAHNVQSIGPTPFSSINGNLTSTTFSVPNSPLTQSFNLPAGTFLVLTNKNINTVLPLRLVSFTAQRKPQSIALQWQSEGEKNVASFEVERSLDGVSFAGIAKVAATNQAGASINNYEAFDTDKQVVQSAKKVFYRLKMVDKDGSFTYSTIVTVLPPGRSKALQVYPNPINGSSQVLFELKEKGFVAVKVLNGTGKEVATIFSGVREIGMCYFALQTNQLNINALSKGTYFLQVVAPDGMQTIPLLQQ